MRTMKLADGPIERRIVTFYSNSLPDATASIKGIPLDITKATLTQSSESYKNSLQSVSTNNPITLFLKDLEELINTLRKAADFKDNAYDNNKRLKCVRDLLLESFEVLKKRKEIDINPQKKLIIEVQENIIPDEMELPGSAILRPDGTDTMAIFRMPERPITWSDFLQRARGRFRDVWKDVIETVLITSLDQLEADNSQIIIADNDKQLKLYRVLLSRNTKFYDGKREFHIYFVEVAPRNEYGSDYSTRLLRALGFCCRFRFMFFETGSDFSADNIGVIDTKDLRDYARRLVRELNLLQRDSVEARLGDPRVWAQLLMQSNADKDKASTTAKDGWEPVKTMKDLYDPVEAEIRRAATVILATKEEKGMEAARIALVEAIRKLEGAFRDKNRELIRDLSERIKTLPDREFTALA